MVRAVAEVEVWADEMPPPREMLIEKISGVDGVLCMITDRIDVEMMDAAGPSLKVVSQFAVGYENIDVAEATRRGVPVGYTPDVLTHATADFAFALILAAGDGSWTARAPSRPVSGAPGTRCTSSGRRSTGAPSVSSASAVLASRLPGEPPGSI